MAVAFIADVSRDGIGTSGSIDTTGADFLVMAIAHHNPSTANLTVSDSKSNTWNALTKYAGGNAAIKIYYSIPSSVGTGHTFSFAGVNLFGKMAAAAFSGLAQVSVFEEENGAGTATGTSLQPGSVTPDGDGSLIISAHAVGAGGGTPSIGSGFTLTEQLTVTGNYGISLAYLIQTPAAAINPTWSFSSAAASATQAVFKPLADAGGAAFPFHLYYAGGLVG